MVKYIEVSNVFRAAAHIAGGQQELYLFFMADNALFVEVTPDGGTTIRINKIVVEVATIFFNEALSFIPCFKYADSEDVILFASRNTHYLDLRATALPDLFIVPVPVQVYTALHSSRSS